MFKIGNVEIKNKVVLAPMVGISNSAFRRIVKEMGAGLIVAEMVSDKAIVHKSQKTLDMLYMTDFERPISQQIFGSDIESFKEATEYIEENIHPDIIDINMGCPVPKVAIGSQAGSALLKDLNKIYDIVKTVVNSVSIPVTVKIRSGWDSNNINAVEVAKVCEKAGASAISIHGRTRSQGYSGFADLDIIKKVKENVNIPVIGNGDIRDVESAKKMIEYTGCDAIMIVRAALGNPWLIRDIVNFFENGNDLVGPSIEDKINMCIKHLDYLLKFKCEKVAVLEMRSHISWYLKGIPGVMDIKNEIFKTKSSEDVKKILTNYLKKIKNNI